MVDDANSPAVRQATWDFLSACPQARLLLEVRTPANMSPDFWNGIQVLAWEQGSDSGYAAGELFAYREADFLRTLTPC